MSSYITAAGWACSYKCHCEFALALLSAECPADGASVVFGLPCDGRDRDAESVGQGAELGPCRVADAALDARQVGRVNVCVVRERFDAQFPALAQPPDGAAERRVGGCSGGRGCARPLRDGIHLPDDLAEADRGAGREHELAVTVDQSGTMEPVHRVECVDPVAAFADDLVYRSGALLFSVDEEVEYGPLGLGLRIVGRDTLLIRHGRHLLLCLGLGTAITRAGAAWVHGAATLRALLLIGQGVGRDDSAGCYGQGM